MHVDSSSGDSLKNLFVVKTPLQLINAMEAIKHFNLKNNILVLIYTDSRSNEMQMKQLVEMNKDDEIIHIKKDFKSKLLKYVKLVYALKKDRYRYVFIGEIGKFHKVLIANIKKEKVFLVDDGTVTLKFYNDVIKKNKYNTYRFKEVRFLLFGLKVRLKDKINLFTYFDLKPIHGIEVVKNELKHLKECYIEGAEKDNDVIYFLGHASRIPVSNEDYKNVLLSLSKRFNKKIIYIPHREERKEDKNILCSLDRSLFELKEINMPIELYFLQNKIYPSHVIAYFSTALITLNKIYDECKIDFIPIPLNNDFDDTLEDIYKVFDEEGFERIIL